ncbi:MAG: hypothetical protein ACOX1A_02465 [Saccharofermentanales bacterium]
MNRSDQRTKAWFDCESDAESRAPGSQLRAGLDAVRDYLPLPAEQIKQPDHNRLADLSAKIGAVEKNQQIIPLALSLSSRELNLIFPLLATLAKTPASGRAAARQSAALIDRLLLIVRERACPSLYTSGWLAFQIHYPNRTIARALTLLCRILEIRLQTGAVPLQSTTDRIHLISQLAYPDTRQFIIRLIRGAGEAALTLPQLLTMYAVDQDSPFGVALIAKSLISENTSLLQGAHMLFGQTLRRLPPDHQIILLRHFFSRKDIPDSVRNRYHQQIYRIYGQPDDADPIWSRLKQKDRQAFQHWVREATIGSHCRQRPDKARLYLKYSQFIQTVEHWDQDTLLIHFPDFLIADSRIRPDQAVYYPQSEPNQPFAQIPNPNRFDPTDPAVPLRHVADAIRRNDGNGIIGLPFTPESCHLTSIFLDLRLSKSGRSH